MGRINVADKLNQLGFELFRMNFYDENTNLKDDILAMLNVTANKK